MTEDKKWYVLRVVSGKEKKLRDQIELEVERSKWSDTISQILVPTEKIYKLKNGKKVISEKNLFPGYILVEATNKKLNGDIISTINSINGVIHFLGKENPLPLPKSEVNRILGKVDDMAETGSSASEPFLVGEIVKIIDGPFNDFMGSIEEVLEDKKKLRVTVKIFGRSTPVELNFIQVEKQ
ncbi:MAG: transcription termination/antitermination protein NusG [Chitinophagales bacterium]|nr:transcription termination/antitermination protein NusG [Chitinophagales bacterium]